MPTVANTHVSPEPKDDFQSAVKVAISSAAPAAKASYAESNRGNIALELGAVSAVVDALGRLGYQPINSTAETGGQRIHFILDGEDPVRFYSLLVEGAQRGWRTNCAPMCLAVLGPDVVGKTTVSTAIINTFTPAFSAHVVAHWRPGILTRIGPPRPLHQPHSRPLRHPVASVLYLATVFMDCCVGHLRRRFNGPERGDLYVFDRYFHDILVDARRYRYNGPEWLPRVLARVVPPNDLLTIILDADEQVIYARKRELALSEIRRQRIEYQRLAREIKGAILIRTDGPGRAAGSQAIHAVMTHLQRRFARSSSAAAMRLNPARQPCGSE